MVRLEIRVRILDWQLFGRIESTMICTCRVDPRKTSQLFSKDNFSSIGWSWYEVYELFVNKVIQSKTRGSCIPIDSVKSGDDYPNLLHILD